MRKRIGTVCCYGLGIAVAVLSTGSQALAGVTISTPEIDGSSVAAGLGLLSAGILLLRARKSR